MILAPPEISHTANYLWTEGGKPAGRMSILLKVSPTSVSQELLITAGKNELRQFSMRTRKGELVRVVVDQKLGATHKEIVVTFENKAAQVVTLEGGGRKVTKVECSGTPGDPSSVWFLTTRPKPGTTVSYWDFSTASNTWSIGKSYFQGVAKAKLYGKDVSAFLVVNKKDGVKSETYLDSNGMPLLIVRNQTRIEREKT
ncbi:MAG: hypothetical protein JSS72_05865 [Armatimonadetes bacterium]|nr:hypothetical protein [Armatimonadota bacterium]